MNPDTLVFGIQLKLANLFRGITTKLPLLLSGTATRLKLACMLYAGWENHTPVGGGRERTRVKYCTVQDSQTVLVFFFLVCSVTNPDLRHTLYFA